MERGGLEDWRAGGLEVGGLDGGLERKVGGEGWRGLEGWRCDIAMRCHAVSISAMLLSAVGGTDMVRWDDTDFMSIDMYCCNGHV